ncbi:GAF domain-containing protein [Streptomyces sp. YC504]|uniref:GAF domain-containing protein n=1 Tax=Streptomyces mesophilus TaxID=1775132 RepID=A0A6G4XP26_9ACTN|nr:GAF domain-containing protein [Streptomyces mesophilus]NGO78454.1 GAF domain-containing protein [Streptomyces mesophilus]
MDVRQDTAAWKRVVEVASAAGRPVALASAVAACVEDVGADGLGVSLITSGQIRTVAHAADERSYRLEDAQLVAGEGPCTEAYLQRRIVDADVQSSCGQWPVFMRTAGELGIRTVVAVPLLVGDGVPVGAMDIYRTTSVPLDEADRVRLKAYGRILALLALDAHPALIGWEQAAPETGPLGYPPVVHQAAGAAAEASDVPVAEALARMRAHAFSRQQLLEGVARDILAGRLRLEEDGDTPPN